MTVAVIMATYNAGPYLFESILSVQAQRYADWRLIIVDDCSTDGTAERAATLAVADGRITVTARESNGGVCVAREQGRTLADHAKYILYLDQDDRLKPNALEILVKKLETRPDASVAYGLAVGIDSEGSEVLPQLASWQEDTWDSALVGAHKGRDRTFIDLLMENRIYPPSVSLIRASAHDEAGPMDQRFRVVQDWDLYLRLARVGPLVPTNTVVAEYRRHDFNVTTMRQDLIGREARTLRRKAVTRYATPEERSACRAAVRRYHIIRAAAADSVARRIAHFAQAAIGTPLAEPTWLRLSRH
jgi:glycosyltransferase involved in cell wall biosynthesis